MTAGEVIRERQLVGALLRRIMERRALLNVTLPDSRRNYHSAILRLEPEEGYLLLDELHPREGHERLLIHRRLQASAMVQGVELRFRAQVQATGEESRIAFYRLGFPEELVYVQRRSSFRVPVPEEARLLARLEGKSERALSVRITDLSEGGVAVEFPKMVRLTPGEVLPLQLHLPDGERLECKLEVRYASEDQAHMRVGGRFVELDPQRRRALARLVADLQRQQIRKGQ